MEDCIVAIASAVGGAVAVLRLSGEDCEKIGDRCWRTFGGKKVSDLPARYFSLGEFFAGKTDGPREVLDPRCLAVRMPGPNSYTGEDVVEFHCHGGALCTRVLLEQLQKCGARMAEPGEFTKRAFLNGKMDLTQAEAVQEMVSAGSQAALQLAGRQLDGVIGRQVLQWQESLDALRVEVESRLDFPEEELDFRSPEQLCEVLKQVIQGLQALAATSANGEILRGGAATVILGAPNVGKSSLLNRILGRDRAIVSAIPGTTRDTIEEFVQLRGVPFRLVDTAGIRARGSDAIEEEGMGRSRMAAEKADLVLWVFDASHPYEAQAFPDWHLRGKLLLVGNKCDLPHRPLPTDAIAISAQSGQGLEELYDAMEKTVLGRPLNGLEIAVSARHGKLFQQAAASLAQALPLVEQTQWELAAIPLRAAIMDLGVVTGKYAPPDVLEDIFSKFCIGK